MRLIYKLTPMKHFLFLFPMQLSKCSRSKGTHIKLQVKYIHTLLNKKGSLPSVQLVVFGLNNPLTLHGSPVASKALQYSWSCEEHNGTLVGSCQIEDTLLNCCQSYCREGNDIYYIDTRSDLGKYQLCQHGPSLIKMIVV